MRMHAFTIDRLSNVWLRQSNSILIGEQCKMIKNNIHSIQTYFWQHFACKKLLKTKQKNSFEVTHSPHWIDCSEYELLCAQRILSTTTKTTVFLWISVIENVPTWLWEIQARALQFFHYWSIQHWTGCIRSRKEGLCVNLLKRMIALHWMDKVQRVWVCLGIIMISTTSLSPANKIIICEGHNTRHSPNIVHSDLNGDQGTKQGPWPLFMSVWNTINNYNLIIHRLVSYNWPRFCWFCSLAHTHTHTMRYARATSSRNMQSRCLGPVREWRNLVDCSLHVFDCHPKKTVVVAGNNSGFLAAAANKSCGPPTPILHAKTWVWREENIKN